MLEKYLAFSISLNGNTTLYVYDISKLNPFPFTVFSMKPIFLNIFKKYPPNNVTTGIISKIKSNLVNLYSFLFFITIHISNAIKRYAKLIS